MIKTSKFLWVFLSIFGALTVLILGVGEKYLPFLFHKTIYLCKHIIESTPLMPLQRNFKLITLSVIAVLLSYITIRLIATIFAIFKQKRHLAQRVVSSEKIDLITSKMALSNQVTVIQDSRLLAFCFGVFNPKIYISTKMIEQLSSAELETVIRHELYHLLNGDALVMMVARVGELLFPFLPFISDITAKYAMHREVQADIFAHANTKAGKRDLIAVLTKMLRDNPAPAFLLSSNLGEYETLELRITLLLEKQASYPDFSSKNVCISIFSLFILGIIVVTPVRAIEYHAEGQDAVMACIDPFGSCKNTCEVQTILPNSTQNTSHLYSPTSLASSSY